jgi:hypothetical protein
MKYLKNFEINNDKSIDLYSIIDNFLEKIKTDRRYVVIKSYNFGRKSMGLAFSFGYYVLLSIRIDKIFNGYKIEYNSCHKYTLPTSIDYKFPENIKNFIYNILEKYSYNINSHGCINSFEILNDKIKSVVNELNKENFEIFINTKKYNL